MQAFNDESESALEGVKPSVLGALKTIDENMMWHIEHKETVVNHLKSNATFTVLSPLLILVATFVTKLLH